MPKSSLTLEQRIQNASSLAVSFNRICFRNVQQRYANRHDIRSTVGSYINGGRFNFHGDFGVLYLSCDPHTCIEEVTLSGYRSPTAVARSCPRTLVGLRVELSKVLDLTRGEVRRAIGINKKLLTDTDWRWHQNFLGTKAPTQFIGEYARTARFEAVLVPSARWSGENLDLFCDKLLSSSKVSVVNIRKLAISSTSAVAHRQRLLRLLGLAAAPPDVQRNLFCS